MIKTKIQTSIVCHPSYVKHLTGIGHPECPQRYTSIVNGLKIAGLKTDQNTLIPRKATEDEILLCHSVPYFAQVQSDMLQAKALGALAGQYTLSTGDVQVSPESFEIALLAAGAVLTAIDAVFEKKTKNAFCVVRPPGHHATKDIGMGFCIFNNVAIGARYAQKKYGIKNVLIVDWDVHHGNGTQDIFEEDPSVFYFSTHQSHMYPGTGQASEVGIGKGKGTTLNFPISAGVNSKNDVIKAFSNDLVKAMENFRPELVLISAGFDSHFQDPLGGFNLDENDFITLTNIMKRIADQYAEGRLVSVLEGGYNLQAIASSSVAHVKALSS